MTSLASQLAQRQQQTLDGARLSSQKALKHPPSFIYTPRFAASVSLDDLHQTASNAWDQLQAIDSLFERYHHKVLGEEAKRTDRSSLTQQENDKLGAVLDSVLRLLAKHMLLKPAAQVLEWLVRRFRVNDLNIATLIGVFLPYHTTSHFPSALALINEQTLTASQFAPLLVARKSLQPIALQDIVAQFPPSSTNNQATEFMNQVIKLPLTYLEQDGKAHRTLVAFWLQIVAAYLDNHSTSLPQGERTTILSTLLDVLKLSREQPDVLVATYILLARYAMHFPFDGQTLRVVLKTVVSNKAKKEVGDEETDAAFVTTLVVLSQLATGDVVVAAGKRFLGGSGWKALMRIERLGELLLQLTHQYNAVRFMQPFLQTLTNEAIGSNEALDVLTTLLQPLSSDPTLVLPESIVSILTDAAISAIIHSPPESDPQPVLKALMQVYQRWPTSWENVSKVWLNKTTDKEDLSLLWSILNTVVAGTVVAAEPSTMYLSSTSSDVLVRVQALEQVIASAEALTQGNPTFLRDTLVARLSEPVQDVVKVVLGDKGVATIHDVLSGQDIQAALLSNLRAKPSPVVLDVILPYLAGPFAQKYPELVGDIVEQVFWPRLLCARTRVQERMSVWKALQGSTIETQHAWIKGLGKPIKTEINNEVDGVKLNDSIVDIIAKNIAALGSDELDVATTFLLDSSRRTSSNNQRQDSEDEVNNLAAQLRITSLYVAIKLLSKLDKTARFKFGSALFNQLRDTHSSVDSLTGSQSEPVLDDQGGSVSAIIATSIYSKPSAFKTTRRLESSAIVASIATVQPLKGTNWKWLSFENISDDVVAYKQLAQAVYALAHTGTTQGGRALATMLLKALFARLLLDDSLSFFASIYTSMAFVSELRAFALKDSATFVKTQNAVGSSKSAIDYQAVVPAVVVALQDKEKQVRIAALELLQSIQQSSVDSSSSPKNIYGRDQIYGATSTSVQYLDSRDVNAYIGKILGSKTEIAMDGAFMATLHQSLLDGQDVTDSNKKKQTLRSKVVIYLCSHVVAWQDLFAKTFLLRSLRGVTDSLKATSILPVLQHIVSLSTEHRIKWSQSIDVNLSNEFGRLVVQPFEGANKKWLDSSEHSPMDIFKLSLALEDDTGLGACMRSESLRVVVANVFNSLKSGAKLDLYKHLVKLSVTRNARIASEMIKTLNDIKPDVEILTAILNELRSSLGSTATAKSSKRGRASIGGSTSNVNNSTATRLERLPELVAVLETVDFKTIEPNHDLFISLFELLASVNDVPAASQADMQYPGQLLLAAMLQSVDLVKPSSGVTGDSIRMTPVLDLMRTSQNPQTCQQALLLLAKLGPLVPDQLVHNIMPIFTFMGANVLQRDDAYSMRVVESTLENIVPSLVKSTKRKSTSRTALVTDLRDLLNVFASAAIHMPKHRRTRLFVKFVGTLGPNEFLSAVTMLLVDKDVKTAEGSSLALTVLEHYDIQLQLSALKQILVEVGSLLEGDRKAFMNGITDVTNSSTQPQQPPHGLILTLLAFVAETFETRQILSKVDAARVSGDDKVDTTLAGLVRDLLDLSSAAASSETLPQSEQQEVAEAASYGVHAVVQLMSIKAFADAILWLLDLSDDSIQIRAFELLRAKLATIKSTRRADISPAVVLVVERARGQLVAAHSGTATVHVATTLSTLDTIVSSPLPEEDAALAKTIPDLLSVAKSSALDVTSRIGAVSIIVKLTHRLGPRLIPFIAKLVPFSVGLLNEQMQGLASGALQVLEGLFSSVPTFIGTQLDNVLVALVSDNVIELTSDKLTISAKARASLISTAAKKLPSKTLFPAIVRLYDSIGDSEQAPLLSLLDILSRSLRQAKASDVLETYRSIFKLFLSVFDLRRRRSTLDVDRVEHQALGAFVQFILKLNEQTFRPLFLRTYDWAVIDLAEADDADEAITARRVVLYKLVDRMLGQLKSIFVPYFSFMLDQTAELLTLFAQRGATSEDASLLWTVVVNSLTKALEFDDTNFWTVNRLAKLSKPISNQVEFVSTTNETTLLHQLVNEYSVSISTHDNLLKQFNTHLLMLTRSDDLNVKKQTLLTLDQVWNTLGDTMLTYVPETTPFLSECLDETQSGVDKVTRKLIKRIEEHLGESLASYLEV
ncbi:snoRNA-binding rRNA-processing protein utp10 [Microbotryomycetes sp. JL221]|nr:snoRNA-binding rRNA-processing protein utp10 [Microbotryomycetes sp. JL221]